MDGGGGGDLGGETGWEYCMREESIFDFQYGVFLSET